MAATVTIDKEYFETLLRRAELHTSGRDLTTPINLPLVSIPKVDHDNLLRMAQEYTTLRDSLYKGGIETENLEILIRGDNVPSILPDDNTAVGDNGHQTGDGGIFNQTPKSRVVLSRPSDKLWSSEELDWPPRNAGNDSQGYPRGRGQLSSRNNSYDQGDDVSWDPDLDKDDGCLTVPRTERKRYAREEQRTIIAKNLSDRATHKDIVDFLRGGLVLDIYLRTNDRSASISFVEGSAAQNFMNHVKRNDIILHGKRLEFVWNDRQFTLPGHVANKIGIGATRNLIIRNVHPNITQERIREDLDHIHNLVIIGITFDRGDAYLQLNSIHNSLFARTCMMSRAVYKGLKIEWYHDECCQSLPKTQYAPKKENLKPQLAKKTNSGMMNRFQMLNLDSDGTEDGSEEGNEPTTLSGLSSSHIDHHSPLNSRIVAA